MRRDWPVVAFDPPYSSPAQDATGRRADMDNYLADNDLDLVWTLLGEKQLLGGWSDERQSIGWLQVSGAFRRSARGIGGKFTPEYRLTARETPRRAK